MTHPIINRLKTITKFTFLQKISTLTPSTPSPSPTLALTTPTPNPTPTLTLTALTLALTTLTTLTTGCYSPAPKKQVQTTVEVQALTIEPKDTPVVFEFIGSAKSSKQVEIRARVDGFLDHVTYDEGKLVEAGQTLFELDKKPLEAALQQTKGELALQNARLTTASANLQRIRPLAEKDAVSKKDLDDAVGQEKQAKAAVLAAEGSVREAELKLGYATIHSPLKGLASKTVKQEGSYIPTGIDSLLTYVAQLDPIWADFSISENQVLDFRQQIQKKILITPPDDNYEVEVLLADGSPHPYRGRISFREPNIDPKTGTFLIRSELANPNGDIRPGQFLRIKLHGAIRKNAILVPQNAVVQGAKGHFVWVIDKNNQAQIRSVDVGPWQGENWFIEQGLNAGDQVIINGIVKLRPEINVKLKG